MKINRTLWKKGVLILSLLFYCGILFADDPPQPPVMPTPAPNIPLPPGHIGKYYFFWLVGNSAAKCRSIILYLN